MPRTNFDTLLEAGCHFGHLRRKWNPAMAPYIFMERNGIHIIDLKKTAKKIDEAAEALKQIAKSGKKILFVATKKQIKDIVKEKAESVGMPYVIERWPGGMLTNFLTIRKAVKKMSNIDKLKADGAFKNLSKRENLQIDRQRAKLQKNLGSIADLTRLPAALFIVDVYKENIAVREANRLGIPICGIVDTNSNPTNIDYVIPANDDAAKSVEVILEACCNAINEGLEERKVEKADEEAAAQQPEEVPRMRHRTSKTRTDKAQDEADEAASMTASASETPSEAPRMRRRIPKTRTDKAQDEADEAASMTASASETPSEAPRMRRRIPKTRTDKAQDEAADEAAGEASANETPAETTE